VASDRSTLRSPLGALQHEAGRQLGLVTRAQALKHGRSDGVILCRTDSLPRKDVTRKGVFPLTSVARTLIDLGATCDEEQVEIALECALRRSLTSVHRLQRRLDELGGYGRRGCRTLRRVLDLRGEGAPAGSVLEVKFVG
jgi:hypothetical protein